MTDNVFNISKGAVRKYVDDNPAKLGVLLLKVAETEADLVDHDDLDALLGAAGNTEADFTNYARKTALTGTVNQDNTNNRTDIDLPDQSWASAGGAANNTLVKLIIFVEITAADTGRIPLTHHDFALTTDGSTLTAQIDADGFFRAA